MSVPLQGMRPEDEHVTPWLAALYVLLLVGFPVVAMVAMLLHLDSQQVTVPFRVLMAVVSLGALVSWHTRRARICFTFPVIASLLLWLCLIARLVHGTLIDPLPGNLGSPVSQVVLLSLGACFLPALAFLEAPSAATLALARRWTLLFGLFAMLAVLYVGLTGSANAAIFRRLGTTAFNPISVGHLGVSMLILALSGPPNSGAAVKVGRGLLGLLSSVVVVASVSRGPIAAALLVLLLVAFRRRQTGALSTMRLLLRVLLLSVLIGAITLGVMYLQENEYVDVAARFFDALQDVSAQERTQMIVSAWRGFLDHPWLGSSFVEVHSVTYPHNIIVESLMATGIVGFALLCVNASSGLRAAWGLARRATPYSWVGLVFIQYVLNGLSSGSLFLDASYWSFGFAAQALAEQQAQPV